MHSGIICVRLLSDAADLATAWSEYLGAGGSRRQVFVIGKLNEKQKKGWLEYFSNPRRKHLVFFPPTKKDAPFSVHVNTRDIPALFQMLVKTMVHLQTVLSQNLGGTVFAAAENLSPLLTGYGVGRAHVSELYQKATFGPKRHAFAFNTDFSNAEYFFDKPAIVENLRTLKEIFTRLQSLAITPSYDEGPVPEYDADRLPEYAGGARHRRRA